MDANWSSLPLRNPRAEDDPRLKLFVIRKDLWEHPKMTNATRAGLIVHEIVYEYFAKHFGDLNSINARNFNATLASDGFVGMSFMDYVEFYSRVLREPQSRVEATTLGLCVTGFAYDGHWQRWQSKLCVQQQGLPFGPVTGTVLSGYILNPERGPYHGFAEIDGTLSLDSGNVVNGRFYVTFNGHKVETVEWSHREAADLEITAENLFARYTYRYGRNFTGRNPTWIKMAYTPDGKLLPFDLAGTDRDSVTIQRLRSNCVSTYPNRLSLFASGRPRHFRADTDASICMWTGGREEQIHCDGYVESFWDDDLSAMRSGVCNVRPPRPFQVHDGSVSIAALKSQYRDGALNEAIVEISGPKDFTYTNGQRVRIGTQGYRRAGYYMRFAANGKLLAHNFEWGLN
jgi:hypothetical protein